MVVRSAAIVTSSAHCEGTFWLAGTVIADTGGPAELGQSGGNESVAARKVTP